jgi:hypothetical protein
MQKVPPEGTAPAAGGCARFSGSQVLVEINPDVPSPRCTIVTAGQHLVVHNNTGELGQTPRTVTVNWADYATRTLAPGASTTYPLPFGSYLLPGVHRVQTSMYGGSGPEIWLQH